MVNHEAVHENKRSIEPIDPLCTDSLKICTLFNVALQKRINIQKQRSKRLMAEIVFVLYKKFCGGRVLNIILSLLIL